MLLKLAHIVLKDKGNFTRKIKGQSNGGVLLIGWFRIGEVKI